MIGGEYMRTRRLGKTDLMVSEIGFGGEWLERHTETEGIELIRYASEKGISDRWNETGERDGSISGNADLEPEWRNVSDCPRPRY